jgi:hypothetical protein
MIKLGKTMNDAFVTEFIEGQDNDNHYQITGDIEIAGVMY